MIDWIISISFLLGFVAISIGGMFLVRKNITLSTLESHNEVAGFIYAVVGVIYAVLVAFVVLVVFEQFRSAEERVDKEATDSSTLYRFSSMYPDSSAKEIKALLMDYNHVMIEKEFPSMSKGYTCNDSKEIQDKLWEIFYHMNPKTENDRIWFTQGIDVLEAFGEDRRLRLISVNYGIPPFMWFVLYLGGFITIAYSYFFGTKNVWSQTIFVLSLSGIVGLVLILIGALEHPFTGIIKVLPEPFEMLIQYFK